jgi:hypothetical protein
VWGTSGGDAPLYDDPNGAVEDLSGLTFEELFGPVAAVVGGGL